MKPTFDAEGYPTEETLECIRNWLHTDAEGLLRFIRDAWHGPELGAEVRPGIWTFVTGGWSGNEEILAALWASPPWLFHFARHSISLLSGLLCIAVGDAARQEMGELHKWIRGWCWRKCGGES